MNNQNSISASLVLYKNHPEVIKKAVMSLLNTPVQVDLYIVDNSPTPELGNLFQNLANVSYYYNNGQNVGFAKAHNLAITKVQYHEYHLVLNPDVYFDEAVIPELIAFLNNHQEVGLIEPKIYSPNGEIQYLCKRYPSVFLLFARRFIPTQIKFLFQNYLDWYEMRDTGYKEVMDVPYLSGCFMLFRRKYLDEIGYFDEKIFMYLEDADITLRMAEKYRSIFYPYVHIYHHWARGAYKSIKLTLVTIQSAIHLFNKHGWKIF